MTKTEGDLFTELFNSVKESGAYVINDTGIVNYGRKWGHGYLIPIKDLSLNELKPHTLFWMDVLDDGSRELYLLWSRDAVQDARKLAQDHDEQYMYSLFDHTWVAV